MKASRRGYYFFPFRIYLRASRRMKPPLQGCPVRRFGEGRGISSGGGLKRIKDAEECRFFPELSVKQQRLRVDKIVSG